MTTKTVSPYKAKLDAGNAYWMARLAQAVYTEKSERDAAPDDVAILADLQKEDKNFVSVEGFNNNSAQAALIEHKDYLCMAFRGTDELADWLDNINVFSIDALFGEFHRGFWRSTEDVWKKLDDCYQSHRKEKRRPLFICGHSLGGAMATVAAARLIHDDQPFASVYTFGQPRVVRRATARIFNQECKSRYFRFHNNNDLVTRVPARLMGYSHVGSYLYISEENKICDDPGFWFRFLDAVDGAVEAVKEKGFDGIEDHDMKNYLYAVKQWSRE